MKTKKVVPAKDISEHLGISVPTGHKIEEDDFAFSKMLTPKHKQRRV